MFVVVGLGNPGDEYHGTRHNVGRAVLECVMDAYNFPAMVNASRYAGLLSEGMLCNKDVNILFPETFMNKSGASVKKAMEGTDKKELVVVYDDIDLPLGEIKVSYGRGSGGHNGLVSIIGAIGTKNFVRIRVGIAPRALFGGVRRPSGASLPRYVLGKFSRREQKVVEDAALKVQTALRLIVTDGVEKAMNQIN